MPGSRQCGRGEDVQWAGGHSRGLTEEVNRCMGSGWLGDAAWEKRQLWDSRTGEGDGECTGRLRAGRDWSRRKVQPTAVLRWPAPAGVRQSRIAMPPGQADTGRLSAWPPITLPSFSSHCPLAPLLSPSLRFSLSSVSFLCLAGRTTLVWYSNYLGQ